MRVIDPRILIRIIIGINTNNIMYDTHSHKTILTTKKIRNCQYNINICSHAVVISVYLMDNVGKSTLLKVRIMVFRFNLKLKYLLTNLKTGIYSKASRSLFVKYQLTKKLQLI